MSAKLEGDLGALANSLMVGRRHKLPKGECAYCDREKGEFHPSHDASSTCESGKRPHCTCDSCW